MARNYRSRTIQTWNNIIHFLIIMNIATNPALVTATDSADTELVFTSGIKWASYPNGATAFIEIVSGSINFNVGADATSGATYTDGQKLILTFFPNVRNIHFKAATAAQTFKISI